MNHVSKDLLWITNSTFLCYLRSKYKITKSLCEKVINNQMCQFFYT